MKRLIAATIALTFFASTAAMADGWHGHNRYDGRSYHHHDNTGAVLAVGVGLAALAIIASQSNDHRDGYHDGYYVQGRYGSGYDRPNYYQRDYGNRGYYDRPAYYGGDDDHE